MLGAILGLPFAPVRMVIWLGETIQQQVEDEMHSPAAARRELEEIERAREAGEISEEEEAEAQRRVLERMTGRPT
jgi:hypothetical protein